MTQVKVAMNHPATMPLTVAVGSLILNCGLIEFETYVWLACAYGGVDEAPKNGLLAARVNRIIAKISGLEGEHVLAAVDAWENVLVLAQFRNRIAHGPLMFGWNSVDEIGLPDVLMVADMQGAHKNEGQEAKVTLADINAHINLSAQLAQYLRNLRDLIWSDLLV